MWQGRKPRSPSPHPLPKGEGDTKPDSRISGAQVRSAASVAPAFGEGERGPRTDAAAQYVFGTRELTSLACRAQRPPLPSPLLQRRRETGSGGAFCIDSALSQPGGTAASRHLGPAAGAHRRAGDRAGPPGHDPATDAPQEVPALSDWRRLSHCDRRYPEVHPGPVLGCRLLGTEGRQQKDVGPATLAPSFMAQKFLAAGCQLWQITCRVQRQRNSTGETQ